MTIDPTKAKYFPEVLPEAITKTSSASGVGIASYAAFSPFAMQLKDLWTNQAVTGESLRIDTDSGHGIVESPLISRPDRLPVEQDILIEDSMDLWAIGATVKSYFAYTLRVTKLTIFEKIKYGISLSTEERALADKYEIEKKYLAGILKKIDAPQFKKIIEVTKEVTVAAGSHTRVGRFINVKDGEKAVLLSMAADSATVVAGVGSADTYLTVNRDISDLSYVKLDCAAMPTIDYEMECYIPALNRHEIILESVTGITKLPVRYTYGIADLTIIEKIRWGFEGTLTDAEKLHATELNLYDSVKAGVL